MENIDILTVTMEISSNIPPVNKTWHIKFERDIIQIVNHRVFKFSALSMNVAVTKIADLVSRHPENYFSEITIKK